VKTIHTMCTVAALTLVAWSGAEADCVRGGQNAAHAARQWLMPPSHASAQNAVAASHSGSIVGLWAVTFLVGNGPDLYDQAFELWHRDGTEFTMDVAVPPAAGNICVGVWVPTGPRSVKLHHVGWNWDLTTPPGTLAGTFVLDMVVTVGKGGRTFSGQYVTDSFDLEGSVIPEFHAEGIVKGKRITVD